MRVMHIITRMIVGGAQENTLYNCMDLIRHHADEVILVTGPTTGPEGKLHSPAQGLASEKAAAADDHIMETRRGAHAQCQGRVDRTGCRLDLPSALRYPFGAWRSLPSVSEPSQQMVLCPV